MNKEKLILSFHSEADSGNAGEQPGRINFGGWKCTGRRKILPSFKVYFRPLCLKKLHLAG